MRVCGIFRKKSATFDPKKRVEFDEKLGILLRKCGFFLIRRLQFFYFYAPYMIGGAATSFSALVRDGP